MQHATKPRALGRGTRLLFVGVMVVCAASCGKKEEKKTDAPAGMSAGAMSGGDAMGSMDAMRPAPDAMRARPVGTLKVGDALRKTLTKGVESSSQKTLDSIRKNLTSLRKTFGKSPQAQMAYQQMLQSVALLEQIAKKVKAGAFAEVPALAATGFVFATMGISQATALAKGLARRAASAARKMQIGKARSLGRQGRALGALGRAIGRVVRRYASIVEALLKDGSESVRVATVAAATKAYPKVSKATQATVASALKRYYKLEKSASVKAQMKTLLKAIQVTVE